MPKVLENPRERILEMASALLMERGYEEFSIREVAKACEIAVGTIYNYFSTKQELVVQVVINYWEGYLVKMEVIDQEESDLFTKLEVMYNQLESFVDTFRGVWMKVSEDHHSFHPEMQSQSHRDFVERLTRRLETILAREVNDEKIISPISVYEMAQFMIQNFLIMAQMKRFAYPSFDKVIRKLLQT